MFSLLRFKHHWRSYQARVLAQLHLHQADRKIHIIAPPGAGKTVLGLEIIQRHRKQTLVLAPSLTIREQWIVRLKEDFIQQGSLPEGLISRDLYRPASITLVTYQALHQFLKKEKSDKLYWIEMLVVDECHHLRREWWRSLDQLYQQVSPFLLALTATPPLDVSSTEWRRYHSFCGEIDEEISIPELVSAGDLCPHQDFIYPVLPEPEVLQRSQAFTQAKAELYQLLREQRFLAYYPSCVANPKTRHAGSAKNEPLRTIRGG